MNHFKNIDKHLETLKQKHEELLEFQETYSKVQREVTALVKKLFEETTLKRSKKGKELKENYHDKILDLLKKENYTQLVVETHMPGIYDPPGLRSKKLPTIKKEAVGPKLAKVVPKIKPKSTSGSIVSTKTTKKGSNCVLGDSDDETDNDASLTPIQLALKNNLDLDTTNSTGINLKIRDIEELAEPILSKLDLGEKVEDKSSGYDYYYCRQSNKVYRDGDDLPEGIGKLVGDLNLNTGVLNLGTQTIQVV